MKRSVTEVIRRGFENTLANWQLVLIRIGASIFFIILLVIAVIAAVVPLAMSIGINKADVSAADNPAEVVLTLLMQHWPIILYILGIVTVLLTVIIALYAFVEAGCARVYVDAELAVAAYPTPSRQQMSVFSTDRWFKGARTHWWQVFWIYNLAWGVAMMLLLLPALAILAFLFLLRDSPGGLAATGCIGVFFLIVFFIGIAIVTNIWCLKAIVVSVARHRAAVIALGVAWREFKADAGRHIGVAVILFVIMLAGTMVFSSMSAISNLDDSATFQLMTLPLQLMSSLLNSIFSAFMTGWFLACFAALTVESPHR